MKKVLFLMFLILVSVGLSAQKEVRKAIRVGNKAYDEQLYATAEAEYSKAKEENANSKEAAFNLANTYYRQQKWDQALAEYQHYLKLENEDPEKISAAWSNMGNTFLKKKANEKAASAQMMMAQQGEQPQGPQAKQEDNLKLSMEAYKNALRFNPNDDETRYNLAVVQKMIKDKEDQDKDQDKDQDQKDDQKQDQKQDQQDQKQDPKQDPKQDQKDQQQQNQMSQDNMQQILQALEQDEKETQERVRQAQARERKEKNEQNRKQNKDW